MLFALCFISLASTAQKESWTQLPSSGAAITARAGAVEFTIGNKAYMGTGIYNDTYMKDMWEYDAVANTWSQKADFGGLPREFAVAFSIGSKGYVGTGMIGNGAWDAQRDFWQYDPTLNNWVQKADIAIPRFEAVGFAINGKGYIATGYDFFYAKGDCNEYDPITDRWTPRPAGPVMYGAACFTIADKAYIGAGNRNGFSSKEFYEYNPSTGVWAQVADFGGNTKLHAAAFSLNGMGYIGTGDFSNNDLWQYDPIANHWQQKASFPGSKRCFATGFNIGNKGYLGLGRGSDQYNDFWVYQDEHPDSLKVLYAGRTYVNLDWVNATSNSYATYYDVYVNGIRKYTTIETAITADSLLPNTSYTFTVRGRNTGGVISLPSNSVTAKTTNYFSGLNYRFYNTYVDGVGGFNNITPAATGYSPNVDISARPAGVNDHFGFVWEGYINIPVPGNYTFETVSDDGSRLFFNSFYNQHSTGLVNNDRIQAPTSASGTVNVATAGMYPFALAYFEFDGGETMQVYWTGPPGSGITRQLIPAAAFTDAYIPYIDTMPPPAPKHVQVLSAARNYISLAWDNTTGNTATAFYAVYVNGIKKYTSGSNNIIADSLLENTAYTFTVKTYDLAGNSSAFSDAVTATTGTVSNGLNYRYYEGTWNSLPDFGTLTPVKRGLAPNADISVRPAGVNDHFGFVWEGFITITTPGDYTFETVSDDGSKLYFNTLYNSSSTPLINNDGLHASNSASGTVNIPAAGQYPVSMTYFEKDGGETMQVYWTGPGIARQLIPDGAFTGSSIPPSDSMPLKAPANITLLRAGRTMISLNWDNSAGNTAVAYYEVYVNGTKKYTTITSDIIADSLAEHTAYTFTVKAYDIAGNSSGFSEAFTTATTNINTGLNYRYYEGNWNTLPDFNALTPVKTGIAPNTDISVRPAGVNDHFGFVWEGYINVPVPGEYTFETLSDDGSRFYFNSLYAPAATALVDNDGIHGPWSAAGAKVTIPAAGQYPVAFTFFEKEGGELMQLYWTGPYGSGIIRQLIPDSAFSGDFKPVIDTIAPTAPAGIKLFMASDNHINLNWAASTDNVGVKQYDVYVNGSKRYTTDVPSIYASGLNSNTTFSFTIKAIDFSGNSSPFSAEFKASTSAVLTGLDYKYYEGTWDVLPNFYYLNPVKKGSSDNVDISIRPAGTNDHFAFLWEGLIKIPTPGEYTFETESDDGSNLYLYTFYYPGIKPLVSNDGLHPATTASGKYTFTSASTIPITITFFEKDGGETMKVYWTGPGIPRQLIPNAAFVRNTPATNSAHQSTANAVVDALPPSKGNEAITKIYPNPFLESFNIDFYNSAAANTISVGIYDLTGKLISGHYIGTLAAGNETVSISVKEQTLLPGIYLVGLTVNGKVVKTMKLVKAKS